MASAIKATDFARFSKVALTFCLFPVCPFGAFLAIAVAAPPLGTPSVFVVTVVRGEGVDEVALRIRNFSISCNNDSAKPGVAIAAAADAATVMVGRESAYAVDIAAIAVFVTAPVSDKTGPIIFKRYVFAGWNSALLRWNLDYSKFSCSIETIFLIWVVLCADCNNN